MQMTGEREYNPRQIEVNIFHRLLTSQITSISYARGPSMENPR